MTLKQSIYNWFVVMGWHNGLFHDIEKQLEQKFYKNDFSTIPNRKTIIFMVDGRSIHGGLADRLRGICSVFAVCKKNNWDFKINFIYPFKLTDYLVPNKYDWSINDSEISYNIKYSAPVLLNSYQLPTKYHRIYLFKRMFRKKQLHVYSESPWGYDQFSVNFNLLFKPSKKLQESINKHLKIIGTDYISVTFRFQQLLGDFKEGNYPILLREEKDKLINECINQLYLLHNKYKNKKILVTADSITFLNSIKTIDYVYVILGNVVHMDYSEKESYIVYEKSFIDYFLIANAKKIHLIYNNQMYRSGFAQQAAKIYNRPYEEIKF